MVFWRIYAAVYTLLAVGGSEDYFLHPSRHTPVDWIGLVLNGFLTIGCLHLYCRRERHNFDALGFRGAFWICAGWQLVTLVIGVPRMAAIMQARVHGVAAMAIIAVLAFAVIALLQAPALVAIYRLGYGKPAPGGPQAAAVF
jgi:hypothetical protein